MTLLPRGQQRQLPPGVRDIFGAQARQLTKLSGALRELFERWGYEEVLPPTFEYFDNVMRAFDEEFAGEIYRFVDPDGHLLALRPDLTVPVARLVATKLYDQPMPKRMSYVAPVFRFSEPNGGYSRQLWQAGWELIGIASPAADAETLALLVSALETAGLERFQVNLGHMGFVRATLQDIEIGPEELSMILRAVDRKNKKSLQRTLEEANVQGAERAVLETLPELWGDTGVLEQALALAPNAPAADAIRHLQEVLNLLDAYGVADRVTVDLGEVRGMDYYTGITFELFAAGSGFPLASGGRYDALLGRFGVDRPAVGAMIELERVMQIYNDLRGEPVLPPPDAIQQQCEHSVCLQSLLERRRGGEAVELDLHGRTVEELRVDAERRGISHVIPCQKQLDSGTSGEIRLEESSP